MGTGRCWVGMDWKRDSSCCIQGVEESSLSIGLDDVVKIDLAVVGCVAVSPTGRCCVLCYVQFRQFLIFRTCLKWLAVKLIIQTKKNKLKRLINPGYRGWAASEMYRSRHHLHCCCCYRPRVGCRVVRIDPLHFLALCHTRQLNQAVSVLSLRLDFSWVCLLCC